MEEVRPVDLTPHTTLLVSTRSTRYELIVVTPLELGLLVKGARCFPQPTYARFHRHDAIKVGKVLSPQIGTRKIVATRIEAIEVID